MSATFENNEGHEDELLQDRFDDACVEALRVLCINHPDLLEDLATGDPVKDIAGLLFADIHIDQLTAECRLSIEVLIKHHPIIKAARSYGRAITETVKKAEIDQDQIHNMFAAMNFEMRQDFIDYLMRNEPDVISDFEHQHGWAASEQLRQSCSQLRNTILNAGAVPQEMQEDA